MVKKKKEYALYKGDTFLAIGTKEELAKYLGVMPTTIKFYKSKSWKKRASAKSYIVIDIEE